MDDKAVEDLQFHQETVSNEENSPLHLIREKEMEISGRVLAAKRQADEIVADARRQAAKLITAAGDEAASKASKMEKKVETELEKESAKVRADADTEAEELKKAISSRVQKAVDFVIDNVTAV